MPEAIGLRALGRETEARETIERCRTIAGEALAMKKYDEHWNHWLLAFCAGMDKQNAGKRARILATETSYRT